MSAILITPEIVKKTIIVPNVDAQQLDFNPFLLVTVEPNQFFLPFAASFEFVNDILTLWTQMQLGTLGSQGYTNYVGVANETLPLQTSEPVAAFALCQSNTQKGYSPQGSKSIYLSTQTAGFWNNPFLNGQIKVTLFYKTIQL